MVEKRPIDIQRERGCTSNIGSEDDGAIIETFNLDGNLIVIKERSVYELIFADNIDPKREHANLPSHTQRLIFKLGTESEMFSRTFLTAKRLFKIEFLPSNIDIKKTLLLSLEVIKELSAMDEEINSYMIAEKKANIEYQDRKAKNLSHAVPSITDAHIRCTTIFQRADHVLQIQMELIRLFYPDFNKQSYYTTFCKFIEQKYGDNDSFTILIKKVLPFIELVRNIRNCLDHIDRTETKVKDFELQLNSDILSPTIEIDYLNSKLERTSLMSFLPVVKENLVNIFEHMIVYLCNKQTKEGKIIPSQVFFIPEERRINKFIKYAYCSPLGEGGYFHQ